MNIKENEIYVKISEVKKASLGSCFKITLGSCIGILMRNPKNDEFALAHCLLPATKENKKEISAKYINHGIESLIELLNLTPAIYPEIEVSIFGGANMLKDLVNRTSGQIGESNILSVESCLKKMGFIIKYSDLGGSQGRNILINTKKNEFVVTYLN